MRKIFFCTALFITANCVMPSARAQIGFDDDVDEGVSDMPLDGGVTLMAAGGFAYIVKKVAARRKSK